MATGRRFLGSVPRLTRRAWEDVAHNLEDFLNKVWGSEADGIPPGFNDVTPTNVEPPVGTNFGDPGTMETGWAAADHQHVATVGTPVPIGIEIPAGEGSASALSRSDHTHGLEVWRTVGVTVDGSVDPISTGLKGMIAVPFRGTIQSWILEGDQAGDCTVDAWKSRRTPTVADSICGTAKPVMAAASGATGLCTEWTDVELEPGDIVAFNVDSAATLTLLTVTLRVQEHA